MFYKNTIEYECINASFCFAFRRHSSIEYYHYVSLLLTYVKKYNSNGIFYDQIRGLKNMSEYFDISESKLKNLLLSLGNIEITSNRECSIIDQDQKSLKQTEDKLKGLLVMLSLNRGEK